MKFIVYTWLSLVLFGCQNETEIRAMIWKGGNNEITRDLSDGKEEFLPTNDPKFLDFRCLEKSDAEKLVREALKHCDSDIQSLGALPYLSY